MLESLKNIKKKIKLNCNICVQDINGNDVWIKSGTILDYIQRERFMQGNLILYKEAIVYNDVEYDICFEFDDDFEVIGE